MNKANLVKQLQKNYTSFIDFMNSLSKEDYHFSANEKWSAGEQLAHIVLSLKPMVSVFQMEKTVLAEKFGKSEGLKRPYDEIIGLYFDKLKNGLKAPDRFNPRLQNQENRDTLCEKVSQMVQTLSSRIEKFSEEELDDLALPHPLIGVLSLREMLFHTIYHAQHHQNLASKALKTG